MKKTTTTNTATSTNTAAADTFSKVVASDIQNAKAGSSIEARYIALITAAGYEDAITSIMEVAGKKGLLTEAGKFDRSTPAGERLGDRVSKIRQLSSGSNANGAKPEKARVSPLPLEELGQHASFSSALKARASVKPTLTARQKVGVAERLLTGLIKTVGLTTVEKALRNIEEAAKQA